LLDIRQRVYVYKYTTTTISSNIKKCDCDLGNGQECIYQIFNNIPINDSIGTQCYDQFQRRLLVPRTYYDIYEVAEQTILKTYPYKIQFGTPNIQTSLNVYGSLISNQICLWKGSGYTCISDWSQVRNDFSSGGGAPIGDVIVIRGYNDCVRRQLDACSNYPGYVQIGAIHAGPAACDGWAEGVDFQGNRQDAGWMIFCKKVQ
jgi:hypothetical protein